ncbi:P-loop containing nucleoside triphosphate hydrolase protein [Hyaloraphidium curvatum]|nr:P-loop containing nucleoside triphosphate hydrolase protein [Hyaloraphidium curvatum]
MNTEIERTAPASPGTAGTGQPLLPAQTGSGQPGYTLTFENVNCTITTTSWFPRETKVVQQSLVDCSGFARPGESLAIIGPSGAGKTTLLGWLLANILSQRKSVGKITGEVLVNGEKPDMFYKKRLGHVAATMASISTMTVRETLVFAAECRMPRASTREERIARVDEVIAGLKLAEAQNTPIGDELIRGLSSGEKRRTEVATEMIARPRMLFLDEPTSGLDDFGARFTMETVLKFVKSENVCVIVVIHQPSEAVFRLFDQVMIICAGRTCYFGRVATAENYFAGIGHPSAKLQNPIEHYRRLSQSVSLRPLLITVPSLAVDVCSADPAATADAYGRSDLAKQNLAELARLKAQQFQPIRYSQHIVERPWYDQIALVGRRTLLRYYRNPATSWGRLFVFTILGLLFGIIFYQLGNNTTGMRNTLGVATTFTFLAVYVAIAAVPQFLEDRELYLQELDSAFYVTWPYWFTYLAIECVRGTMRRHASNSFAPHRSNITTVITTIQILMIWPMAGFPWAPFGHVYAMMLVQFWLATAVAQAWSAWCRTLVQAYTALWAAALIFYAFSGAMVPLGTVSPALRWLADVNYWRWCLQYVVSVDPCQHLLVHGF